MFKVFIDGKEGTTGLKIYDRLKSRKDVKLLLLSDEDRKNPSRRKEMMELADVVFLCLPDEASRQAVSMMQDLKPIIIDASTAHRTLNDWAYGLPELSEVFLANIAKSNKIAVPGCHASGFSALIYPLVLNGILPKDYPLTCTSITGYSGGGKKMIAEYENRAKAEKEGKDLKNQSEFDSPRQYALGQEHKHLKEMQYVSELSNPPIFMPIVADFYCGMQVTIPIYTSLLKNKLSPKEVHAIFSEHYNKDSSLISVLPFGSQTDFLPANKLANLDNMEIIVSGNDERILLIASFDNLGKGASGAAVQCMNIALDLPASLGLEV